MKKSFKVTHFQKGIWPRVRCFSIMNMNYNNIFWSSFENVSTHHKSQMTLKRYVNVNHDK